MSMSPDMKQVLDMLGGITTEVKEVKEFLLLHTAKIESIEPLARRVSELEKKIAVMETTAGPNYKDIIQTVAWMATFGLLAFQTFVK